MRNSLYPREPKGDYFIFRFDDEISLGNIDINTLISTKRIEKHTDYAPIFVKGEELIQYRK